MASQPMLGPRTQSFEAEKSAATLLIRHLPEAIPQDTLSRLFSSYGASSVRPCTSGRLRNCAFVDFKSEMLASQALRQLNGDLGEGLKSSSLPASEPIAARLGIDYPFPPHLEYAYPPPDGNILTNIVNALIAVPRFYVQMLHLMNKMNIPAPFRMALPTPPLPTPVPAPPPPPPPPEAARPNLEDLSSGESEMESSDEEVDGKAYSPGPPRETKPGRKRVKREAIVGPGVDKDVAHEAVGVKPATLVPKEIPMIKKKNPVLQIKIAPKVITEHKDECSIMKESEDSEKEDFDLKHYATLEELKSGKLPPEEILSLPMFKNYTAGNPAPVLYIKNLAKDVVVDDFYFIFGSLFGSVDAAKSGLSVKLMQNVVNGYVFKGKPMIIQFGRNPAAAKEK